MDALGSPLEALALNYLRYGFLATVNSIWAWLAVVTAAFSFWRMRALSSPPPVMTPSSPAPPKAPENAAAAIASDEGESKLVSSAPSKALFSLMSERESGTKTKFSLYYNEDGFREDGGGEGEGEDDGNAAAEMSEDGRWIAAAAARSEKLDWWWCDDWERVMVVRMGDLGWYRRQDTTVLDGSVVRLWEGRRRIVRHVAAAALVVDGGTAW